MGERSKATPGIDRRLFIAGVGASLLAGCTSRVSDGTATGESAGATGPAGAAASVTTPTAPAGRELGSLLDAVQRRRSVRRYTDEAVPEKDIALMAWSAQGITDTERELRAAPSAMAAYPLTLWVATAEALRRYVPNSDSLEQVREGDVRPELGKASGQSSVVQAPVVFIVTGQYGKLRESMGDKAERCVHLEAGHATQNLVLTATSLGLAGVTAGAFEDSTVQTVLGVGKEETPFYLVPIGHPEA